MKLATFEKDGREAWGVVLLHPAEDRLWIYEPGKVDRQLQLSATMTNGYSVSMPAFMPDCQWPDTLRDFLALEDQGMDILRKMVIFLERFLEQSDEARMSFCGYPLEDVQLLSPIPDPRLMWGLVQNCPTFIRSNPQRQSTNLYPQGHQRPATAIVGNGQIFYHPKGAGALAYNCELGIIIGKKGRYIPVNRAMEYVAGYTVVIDSQINGYHSLMDSERLGNYDIAEKYDWYVGATCSWGGKMADAHCVVGPYLTTREEIGNPYDLLVYTRMAGKLRDRAHTAGMLLGIERTIQWYSSFATLYPGDIIHMGTLGTDGLRLTEDTCYNGLDCTIDSEIERVGLVKSPVLNTAFSDWRKPDDETITAHVSPVVRKVMRGEHSGAFLRAEDWNLSKARSFWTLFRNYERVQEDEGGTPLKTPRFLDAPTSALGLSGQEVELPRRCRDLTVSIELAAVVKDIVEKARVENAQEHVLGYLPMISLNDSSFGDFLIEPTTKQEKGLPAVYGRWADGFNVIPPRPVCVPWEQVRSMRMRLTAGNGETVEGNCGEYVAGIEETLAFISSYITLLPGDVITLGCVHAKLRLPMDAMTDGMVIGGEIQGLGQVNLTLRHAKEPDSFQSFNQLKL